MSHVDQSQNISQDGGSKGLMVVLCLIGILVIAGISGVVGYKIGENKKKDIDPYENWNLYTNSKYNFKFKYPDTVKVEELSQENINIYIEGKFLSIYIHTEDSGSDFDVCDSIDVQVSDVLLGENKYYAFWNPNDGTLRGDLACSYEKGEFVDDSTSPPIVRKVCYKRNCPLGDYYITIQTSANSEKIMKEDFNTFLSIFETFEY